MRLFLLVLVAIGICFPTLAFAQAPGEQLTSLLQQLDAQDALDTTGAASKDRALARKWVGEAKTALADGSASEFEKKMRKAQFGVELVTAVVAAAVIRTKADEQEAASVTAPKLAAKLKADIEQLLKRKQKLERELQQLGGQR